MELPYITKVMMAASHLLNALLGGAPDEMLSARAWRLSFFDRRWEVVRIALDTVFFWEESHCMNAFDWELKRKISPRDFDGK